MKYAALLIAGIALAGCDITLGANGPVITQGDNILRRVVPIGTQTQTTATQTTAPQTATTAGQTTPTAAPRTPFTISNVMGTTARPVGVTRGQVDSFKSAVAEQGCTIATREQRAAVQSRTGFDADKTDSIVAYLWRTGEVDRNSGNYQLTSGRCDNA